jgi:hypothetical protein
MLRERKSQLGTDESYYNADQGAPPVPAWNWQNLINSVLQWTGFKITPIPLQQFPGEIQLGASVSQSIDIQTLLGPRCTGVSFVNVTGVVQYSLNGGGFNTCPLGSMSIDDALIQSLLVQTGPASSVNVQLRGV